MEKRRVVVIREDILSDERLTATDKIIYAWVCSFDEFSESSATTAELLGLKADTVKKAKAKLEKLGYIRCIRNTGRGKVYISLFDDNQTSTRMSDR